MDGGADVVRGDVLLADGLIKRVGVPLGAEFKDVLGGVLEIDAEVSVDPDSIQYVCSKKRVVTDMSMFQC